jgi:holliday junction DNA helicase RuvA
MIASVTGVLATRGGETIVVQTDGGLGYEITVPLGVAGRLPPTGGRVSLHTELVVKEDGWSLFGFDRAAERQIFQRLLGASGFGPKLALALLSALGPERTVRKRTVRSIRARDLAALSSVGGIGRKKAERLVLELRDRFDDLALEPETEPTPGSDEAVRALVGLGYAPGAAEDAVRASLAAGASEETPQLIRRALQRLAARGGS